METATVYKIVGDLAPPLPDMWNARDEASLKRKCAAAGRVIHAKSSDFGTVAFFQIAKGSENHVWLASRALQLAIVAAKSGSTVTCAKQPVVQPEFLEDLGPDDPLVVEDRENREGCAQPGATVARLKLDRIIQLDVHQCPEAKESVWCVSADFLRRAVFNHQEMWTMNLRYEEGRSPQDDVASVGAVTLEPNYSVTD
jgi:hypothetical protein